MNHGLSAGKSRTTKLYGVNMVKNKLFLYESVLSNGFCDYVLNSVDWSHAETGLVTPNKLKNFEKRITDVVWQEPSTPIGCVAQTYIAESNVKAEWNFLLSTLEQVQIGRYAAEDGGHYGWHLDGAEPENGMQRKLSVSILLNDPSEFEGGELQLKYVDSNNTLTKRGSIVVFPSFMEHRVTPVTKGVRYSAVTWALGPAFR